MIYKDFQGKQLSALGLGCMRFPVIDGNMAQIDEAKTAEMVDYAMKSGINYYDTAYGYHGGTSEPLMGKLLVKYPRESFYLASKFPGYDVKNLQNKEQVFASQLQRCQTEYFDFYLCHSVTDTNIDNYLDPQYGLLEYLKAEKAAGRIRHLGFSCHASLEQMERFIVAAEGAVEFCQIQLNWLDWTLQDAKAKVEMLAKYGIPVWVMEPVRGGALAKLKDDYAARLQALAPDRSAPEWAFRFLQGLPGVTMTLSGMSNMEQLQQNIATYATAQPLGEAELAELLAIGAEIAAQPTLPCTACRYCTEYCPQQLDIPKLIEIYNEEIFSGGYILPQAVARIEADKRPDACIGCQSCEAVCPQGIKIATAFADFCARMK